ncbi:MAG: 4-amino-4-deoxychorismate lyase [Chthoniobacteraceae bacterium]|nr:4-amino-4-deoxychorismate lyase [Chthoniobacteraceae bacterium]
MSVFESIRLGAGSGPQYLEEHLALLSAGCAERAFPLDQDALNAAGELLKSWKPSGEHGGDAFARIYVTAGDGAPTAPVVNGRIFIFIEPRERPVKSSYAITIAEDVCHPPFGGIKTGNYWMNLDVLQRAQKRGRDEALLFNERAELVSACVANVFLVHGSRIRTPSIECGARAGVIRQRVIERFAVEQCSLFVQDIINADEIFLTNSWIGVMPVASVRERMFPPAVFAPQLADL